MTHHYTTTPLLQFPYCSCLQHLIRQCFGFVLPNDPDEDYDDDDDDDDDDYDDNHDNVEKDND